MCRSLQNLRKHPLGKEAGTFAQRFRELVVILLCHWADTAILIDIVEDLSVFMIDLNCKPKFLFPKTDEPIQVTRKLRRYFVTSARFVMTIRTLLEARIQFFCGTIIRYSSLKQCHCPCG